MGRLQEAVEDRGFVWLEANTICLGPVAVVGSLVWYDYSAVPPELGLSVEALAAAKASMNNDAHWIDWPWSDVEMAEGLRRNLVQRLERLDDDEAIDQVVLVTHVPIFEEQLVRRPEDSRWTISNAYFGNLDTGNAVLPFRKLAHVLSGHTHTARNARIEREGAPPIDTCVIGSDYGEPACALLDLCRRAS